MLRRTLDFGGSRYDAYASPAFFSSTSEVPLPEVPLHIASVTVLENQMQRDWLGLTSEIETWRNGNLRKTRRCASSPQLTVTCSGTHTDSDAEVGFLAIGKKTWYGAQ